MKYILAATFLTTLAVATAQATLFSTNWNTGFVNGNTVLDNNASGWTDTRTVSAPSGTLQSVAVNLQLSGGWNGDLYAYLLNDTGFVVLLNRVGQGTGSEPTFTYGYGTGAMNVTLANNGTVLGTALGNIHNYGGGPVSGLWNPDSTGTGNLNSFQSGSASGTWTLFISDLSSGGITTVNSWGLQMDIVPVPEVETWVAAALAGAFGAFWLNRQIWGRNRNTPPTA